MVNPPMDHASRIVPKPIRLFAGAVLVPLLSSAFLAACLGPTAPDQGAGNDLSYALATSGTLEAEAAARGGAAFVATRDGVTYVDFVSATGDYVDWTLSTLTAGTYTISFRYANGSTIDRPLKITDGSTTLRSSFSFPSTGSWTTWKTVSFTQAFTAGTHHVRITTIGSSGGNFDKLTFALGGTTTKKKVVLYLPNWYGGYDTWASKTDFGHMTHVNLAFGSVTSTGTTTLNQSSSAINALVTAAHNKGVKVLVSIGGAAESAKIGSWVANNRSTYVNNLINFVNTYKLDGVDVDLEGSGVNSSYAAFVSDLVNKLRPNGKLVTAALAPWFAGKISTSTMQSFDFVNVMAYDECGSWTGACEQSTYASAVNMLNYFSNRGVSNSKQVLGVPFYGWCWGSGCGTSEWSYAKILSRFSDAYTKDWIQVSGITLSYNGRPTITKKATLAKSYGGIMAWEYPSDATGSASLTTLMANTLWQ